MMANTHCAQCSDTRNIYIKTCDCSKERVNQVIDTKTNSIKKEFNNSSAVDQKKQSDEPKIRAVKAVLYRVVRVYETVPSKTMKIVGALTLLLLIVAVFSVALAQNKEETKNQYGMAFPLEDNNPINPSIEQKVTIIGSIPGEGQSQSTQETTSESPVTTTSAPTTDESPITTEDSEKKLDDIENQGNDVPAILLGNPDEDEDKSGENGEEKTNPRLVFIERLMGLHLSAPFNGPPKENERDDNAAMDSEPELPFRNPFDKVNAKWATRMRKFSIPLMGQNQEPQPPETPNPLLRVAAAAMMTRLLAAAARAHNNGPMMAKDKDDDAEEETVPVLLAAMRSDEDRDGPMGRPLPPMYGRPMPRPQIMRPPMRPPIKFLSQGPQQRMATINIPQRTYASQMVPQRSGPLMQRALPPIQPVLVMLAHVPVPMQMAESRMSRAGPVQYSPYYSSQQQSLPIYPQSVPYSLPVGYHPIQRHVTVPVEVPTPVHVPVPVASYHKPVYQMPYQSGPTVPYQRQSMSRPVIEIPIEIPVPVHMPMSYGQSQHQHNDPDHDSSPSEAEHVAILYVDPEANESFNDDGSDHLEPQTSESNENTFSITPQKGFPYLSRPLPNIQSATKLKLWREYVGAKHAAQPGVRYIPVAVSTDDSQSSGGQDNDSHPTLDQSEPTAESQPHPAFVILADEAEDAPQHH